MTFSNITQAKDQKGGTLDMVPFLLTTQKAVENGIYLANRALVDPKFQCEEEKLCFFDLGPKIVLLSIFSIQSWASEVPTPVLGWDIGGAEWVQ